MLRAPARHLRMRSDHDVGHEFCECFITVLAVSRADLYLRETHLLLWWWDEPGTSGHGRGHRASGMQAPAAGPAQRPGLSTKGAGGHTASNVDYRRAKTHGRPRCG